MLYLNMLIQQLQEPIKRISTRK